VPLIPLLALCLYYEDEGAGRAVVLIHGWPMSARMWDDQAAALRSRYRVIRYDRRGFGRSPAEPWNESSAGHDPQDLAALLDYLNVRSAYLVGHSQGGSVAMSFTLAHPERVEALVLHGSGLDGFVLPETGPFASHDSVKVLMQEKGMPAFREAWAAHPINHVPEGRPEVRARLSLILNEYTAGDVLTPIPPRLGPTPARTAAIHRLSEIRTPTLVLVGDTDLPFFQIIADALVFLIPGAEKVVVPGGGHIVNMIEPERYNAELLRFLRSVER
jgi:pimeloyl-ACP methyl ester carboxylesterase